MSKAPGNSDRRWKFAVALLIYAVACKVLPYVLNEIHAAGFPIDPQNSWFPWNFSPFWAVFAFCGAIIPSKRWSIGLPLLVMLASDGLIQLVHGNQFFTRTDWIVQAWVYASFLLCGALGVLIRRRVNWFTGLGASLPGAVLFFLTTNYAMWAFGEGQFYPATLEGLLTCYIAGLPFFVRSLLSTTIYAGLFFSPWGLGLAGVEASPESVVEPALTVTT